jgi:H+/gluconate symporter-like permease
VAHNGVVTSETGQSEPRASDNPPRDTLTEVRVRRAPRLPVFLVLGALLGAIATLIATATVGQVDPKVGFGASFGYFCLYGVPVGIVVGAIVGLLLDRRSRRRSRVVTAEYSQVETPPPPQA